MKPIKMLCLVALAALMGMAFVGVGSATAEPTSLCAEDPGEGLEEECPEGQAITHVHEATLTGHKAVLKTSILTVECDVLFLGDALSELGKPLVIHGEFTYTNCGGCTVTEENSPSEIKVSKEGHETASVTGEGLVHVNCSGLNCRYTGEGLKATAKGPLLSTETNGEVSLTGKEVHKESGLFCPKESKLTITTTPLEPTYITGEISPPEEEEPKESAEPTSLCAEDPGEGLEEECPEGQAITHVHEATLTGHKAVLKTSILTVECDVLFLGDALSELGKPLVIHGEFTYTNCGGCTVTEENSPSEIKVSKEGHETASVTGEGLVHVNCSGLNCRYTGEGLKATAKGPLLSTETNGEVSLTGKEVHKESGLFCPKESKLTITTTPLEPTYITGEISPPEEEEPKESAEPTSLCAEDPGEGLEEECPEGQAITHVHEATLTGHKAVLKTSILTVECDVLFLGDALSELGKPLVIHGEFTYTNCGGCTVTEENSPSEIKVSKEGHETASVTGEGLVHVNCSGLNCRYTGEGLKATAKGPLLSTETNGEVSLTGKEVHKESGLFCPKESKLTITTTPLEPTYVTE